MFKEVITKTEYFYLEPYHFKENTNINELKPRRNSSALDVNEKYWKIKRSINLRAIYI